MENYQKRVVTESEELDQKIKKLSLFLKSEKIELLKKDDVDLLVEQSRAMNLYFDILQKRIANFE